MLLCQLCGIPMNQEITLADEDKDALNLSIASTHAEQQAALNDSSLSSRPELRLLQNVTDASKQATNLVKAAFLPHVALTGGYMISNPNVWNGFQKNFTGVWNVGVLVQIPVWNWGEGAYKVTESVQGKGSREKTQYGPQEHQQCRGEPALCQLRI